MKLEWTNRARNNRLGIMRYISRYDIDAAHKINERIKNSAKGLLDFPRKGRLGIIQGTFELFVKPHFLLIYRIRKDTIQILAVVHNSQDYSILNFDDIQ